MGEVCRSEGRIVVGKQIREWFLFNRVGHLAEKR